jgi:hypothetical protein
MSNNKDTQFMDFSDPNADKITSASTNTTTVTNNKAKTAVETFCESLASKLGLNAITFYIDHQEEIKQAKENEKNQMINFAFHYADEWFDKVYLEKEYSKTYGGNK